MKKDLENQTKETFEKLELQAKDYVGNVGQINDLIDKAESKLKSNPAMEGLKEIPMFVEMIKSYVKGEYKEIPVGTIIAIIAALIYWVAPIDVIPDVIPGVGYVDDALVVAYCLTLVKSDLDEYVVWYQQNKCNA